MKPPRVWRLDELTHEERRMVLDTMVRFELANSNLLSDRGRHWTDGRGQKDNSTSSIDFSRADVFVDRTRFSMGNGGRHYRATLYDYNTRDNGGL